MSGRAWNSRTVMLCTSCRRSLLSSLRYTLRVGPHSTRYASTSSSSALSPSPSPSSPLPHHPGVQATATTSSAVLSSATPGISQPLSTTEASSIQSTIPNPPVHPQKLRPKPTRLIGSVPAGALLHGLAYLKNQPQIVAKEDDEYPDWLWKLLDDSDGKQGGEMKVVVSGKPTLPTYLLPSTVLRRQPDCGGNKLS